MSATVPTESALPSVEEIEAAILALEDVDKTADSFCVRLEAAIRDAEVVPTPELQWALDRYVEVLRGVAESLECCDLGSLSYRVGQIHTHTASVMRGDDA